MTAKRLEVALPGRVVGALVQERSGLVRWTPDPAWERDQQEPRLGLDFLRTRGARSDASELLPWFENLLPERGSELRARLCALHALRDGQSFALLRVLGGDLIGAAEAVDSASNYDSAASDHVPGQEVVADSLDRMSALTGMQLKFSMSMVNERLVLPARANKTQWIVKIPREYPELAEVEVATMTWARASGFQVPDHHVVPISALEGIPNGWVEGDAAAFAVQRFDRREDGTKIHQEDFCQALGLRPREKYGDAGNRVSFEGALRLAIDACGEADGREMARRIGFMLACGNTDAHLKNWSLLWGDRVKPTLTPCYDLVSTISWDKFGWQNPGGPRPALSLGGERFFRLVAPVTLDAFAKGTSAEWAKGEVLDGIDRARAAWLDMRALAPARMRAALELHWDSVPLLRHVGPLPT